jgi:hypothetical protein
MNQTARRLLVAVALALAVSASGFPQESPPRGRLGTPVASDGPDIVAALPKIPELPVSLSAPPPHLEPGHNPLDTPYFVPDPILDPPTLPPPGWFAGVDVDVLTVHVNNQLVSPVAAPKGSITLVVPSAPLDWTVSPKVFVGYRLPSGFGELLVSYRGLSTRGSEGIAGADGPATLTSRFDFNIFDIDYSSREFSLWDVGCDMRWFFGARTRFLYFDTQANQPFAQAAAGSGIVQTRETNSFKGVGPHAGLELSHRLGDSGLAIHVATDFTTNWPAGRVKQGFFAQYTTTGPDGRFLAGESHDSNWIGSAVVQAQAGVSWQPPAYPDVRLFLGYQFEYWWNVGKNFDTGSSAELWDQGFLLQGCLRF